MDYLSNFVDHFTELFQEKNLTIEEFSAATKIASSEVYRYFRKECIPKLSNLIKIADAYSYSIDYLLGRIPYPEHTTFHKTPPFSQRFRELLKGANLTRYMFSIKSEIAINRIDDWYHGKCLPSLEKALKMVKFFKLDTLDCLFDREN